MTTVPVTAEGCEVGHVGTDFKGWRGKGIAVQSYIWLWFFRPHHEPQQMQSRMVEAPEMKRILYPAGVRCERHSLPLTHLSLPHTAKR